MLTDKLPMKIEQIIVLHLYKNKKVSLQGIGIFSLDPSFSPGDDAGDIVKLLPTPVTFAYDPKAAEDTSLIDTIIKYTNKLKPLASADLDSFLSWQKQLLNINMAFNLGDIGELQKTAQGVLQFTPRQQPVSKVNSINPEKATKEGRSIAPKNNPIGVRRGKKLVPAAIALVFAGLTAWAFYEFGREHEPGNKNSSQKTRLTTPGNKLITGRKDTLKSTVTLNKVETKNVNDPTVFKIVFLKTPIKEQAMKTLDDIYSFGHSAIMYSTGSGYKIAMPFNRPLNDTSKIKDSLNRYNSLINGSVEKE